MTSPERHSGVRIPRALRDGVMRTPDGAAWAARLPELASRARARWALRVDDPFSAGSASWTAPAVDATGRDLVLKLVLPHEEARHEATALRAWAGRGAVELVAAAPDDWALLLERVRPGTPLSLAPGTAISRVHDAARAHRLLIRAGDTAAGLTSACAPAPDGQLVGVRAMAEVCAGWADLLQGRAERVCHGGTPAHAQPGAGGDVRPARLLRFDTGIVAEAITLLRTLPGEPAQHVLVHGDFNPGNLLIAADGALRAIDPKPLLGDPAFDPWPLLEQIGGSVSAAAADPGADAGEDAGGEPTTGELRSRCVAFANESGLDPTRIAAWSLARSVEEALWSWDIAGDVAGAGLHLARASSWAAVMG